jgi:hypothetical protein
MENIDIDLLKELVYESINKIDIDLDRNIELSNNKMRRFNECPAGYLYEYIILPRIKTEANLQITDRGLKFHKIAEDGFKKSSKDRVLYESDEEEIEDINNLIAYTKTLPYIDEPYKSEVELVHQINEETTYLGILDRLYKDTNPVLIVDWKTTRYIYDPSSDKKQGLGYVYLFSKITKTKPENIKYITEYVSVEKSYPYVFDKKDLIYFENFIKSTRNRIKQTEGMFLKTRDIKSIRHIRGNCKFCVMAGSCRAYQILLNPIDQSTDLKHMTTEEIAREFYKFDEAASVANTRSEALRKALMERYNTGDTSVTQFVHIMDGIKYKNYDTDGVLSEILEKCIKKTKRVEFADLIDWKLVKDSIKKDLMGILPKRIKASNVDSTLRSKLGSYEMTSQGSSFIKKKS